jgi:hypothetical protein
MTWIHIVSIYIDSTPYYFITELNEEDDVYKLPEPNKSYSALYINHIF